MKIPLLRVFRRNKLGTSRSGIIGMVLKWKTFLFLLLLIVIGILFFRMGIANSLQHDKFKMASPQERMAILQEAVEKKGIEYGWQLLAENDILPVGDLPYFLGEKLFQTYGLDGSSRCPKRFSSGCRAGFLQSALEEYKLDSISELQDICRSWGDVSSCAHGFGHGFIHVADNTSSAILYCNKYVSEEGGDRRRCWLGVFQEDAKLSPITPDSDDIWGFCTGMPEEYQSTCAYALETKKTEMLGLSQITELCTLSDNPNVRRGCIVGLSHRVLNSERTAEHIMERCNSLFSAKEERISCMLGAAEFSARFPEEGLESTAVALCRRVPEFYDKCADMIANPNMMRSLDAVDIDG